MQSPEAIQSWRTSTLISRVFLHMALCGWGQKVQKVMAQPLTSSSDACKMDLGLRHGSMISEYMVLALMSIRLARIRWCRRDSFLKKNIKSRKQLGRIMLKGG